MKTEERELAQEIVAAETTSRIVRNE